MRVLVVEDEPALVARLSDALAGAGYVVDVATDGARGEYLGQTESYDAVVLDLGLPSLDGLAVLDRWRTAGVTTPVLVLTARGDWHDKVRGIDGGADDYVAKPFRMEEVLARLRALLRRASGQAATLLTCGRITLDPRQSRAALDGVPVPLTSHEYRVLAYLMHHRGRLVPQAELADHIYARDLDRDSNTVEVFIGRLRKKLGAEAIETVRRLGYRMNEPPS